MRLMAEGTKKMTLTSIIRAKMIMSPIPITDKGLKPRSEALTIDRPYTNRIPDGIPRA